jgi:hypothetical protein
MSQALVTCPDVALVFEELGSHRLTAMGRYSSPRR